MSTLTQFEFDRLELALQNSKPNWQPSPNKRVTQLAFEEIEELRRAGLYVWQAQLYLIRAHRYQAQFKRSKRSKREQKKLRSEAMVKLSLAMSILGRKANVTQG